MSKVDKKLLAKFNPFIKVLFGVKIKIIKIDKEFEIEVDKKTRNILKELYQSNFFREVHSLDKKLVLFLLKERVIVLEDERHKVLQDLNILLNLCEIDTKLDYSSVPTIKNNLKGEFSNSFSYLLNRNSTYSENSHKKLDMKSLEEMFTVAYGNITNGIGRTRKTVSSAGGFYPLNLYYLDLKTNILYRFDNKFIGIKTLNKQLLKRINEKVSDNTDVEWNGLVLVSSNIASMFKKYDLRSYVFSLMEAGQVLQNITHYCTKNEISILNTGFIDEGLMSDIIMNDINFKDQISITSLLV